jgi:hypothetical protein
MRAPILAFDGGLRVYRSRSDAERALSAGGVRPLDAYDAAGRPLRLVEGGRSFLGLFPRSGVHLEASASSAGLRKDLRVRLAEALVRAGAKPRWAEGAPLGALVAEAARRMRA